MLRPMFGLRPNLRLNLTSRQRLGLRIFLAELGSNLLGIPIDKVMHYRLQS